MNFCKGASWGGVPLLLCLQHPKSAMELAGKVQMENWIEDRSLIVSDHLFDFTFTAAETSHYQAFS